ncbi:MAG: hypothetical protein KC897_11970 [Candidatus Omnitrophica bacterium]|nr:hypothetical protein [Candidatus Omnitrophota bacterium]
MSFWKRGQLKELSDQAGVSQPALSDIIHRRRGVGRDRALRLEAASERVLGYAIPVKDWLMNKITRHPAFYGHPAFHKVKG